MDELQVCDLCEKESSDCRPRIMIHRRFLRIGASVEQELVCPRCRTIEQVKSTIGLGLLLAIALAAVIGTIAVL